ncbi:MAG: dienelactone hydrolase family protein [Deltaproteobacteria bacterium]|nr:dienelactone hydrolase family protein [Deltaproteobacteria bacterium]
MNRLRLLLGLLLILGSAALFGCPEEGGNLLPDDDDTTGVADDDDDDSTSEPPTPTVATPVSLDTDDGLELRGTWQAAPGVTSGPAVVLLHELYGDRQDFNLIWDVFQDNGISTFGLDFRGHGASPDASVDVDTLRITPGLLEADVRAALDYVASQSVVDPSKIGVLGLDVGANLAVLGRHASRDATLDNWGVATIVAITPDIEGIEALGGMAAGDLVLANAQYVAGENAPDDADDATALHDDSDDPKDLRIVLGTSAHGAAMLTGSSDARAGIVAWFSARLSE